MIGCVRGGLTREPRINQSASSIKRIARVHSCDSALAIEVDYTPSWLGGQCPCPVVALDHSQRRLWLWSMADRLAKARGEAFEAHVRSLRVVVDLPELERVRAAGRLLNRYSFSIS
jgi:hypothetical protein